MSTDRLREAAAVLVEQVGTIDYPPGVALALADLLDAEAAGDGYLPHRFPEDAPAEVIAWKCQACGEVIREMYGPTTTCPVDWRPRNHHVVAVADQILASAS